MVYCTSTCRARRFVWSTSWSVHSSGPGDHPRGGGPDDGIIGGVLGTTNFKLIPAGRLQTSLSLQQKKKNLFVHVFFFFLRRRRNPPTRQACIGTVFHSFSRRNLDSNAMARLSGTALALESPHDVSRLYRIMNGLVRNRESASSARRTTRSRSVRCCSLTLPTPTLQPPNYDDRRTRSAAGKAVKVCTAPSRPETRKYSSSR